MELREGALALLATRVSLLGLSKANPKGLVVNCLATLLAVSRRRPGNIMARYAPEPMVGAAAFVEMGRNRQLEDALKALIGLLDAGGASSIFATGSAGEFIAAVMVVFAYDHALRRQLATGAPTVLAGPPQSRPAQLRAVRQMAKALAVPTARPSGDRARKRHGRPCRPARF